MARSYGSDGWRIGHWLVAAREDGATDGLDGSPCAGLVAVDVLGAGGVVLNHERAYLHAEGTLGVVGGSTRPRDGARAVSWVTTAPCAKLDLHGRLGVLAVGVLRLEGANSDTIDLPNDLIGGPFDGVLLVARLAARICVEGATVVGGGLSFAKLLNVSTLI